MRGPWVVFLAAGVGAALSTHPAFAGDFTKGSLEPRGGLLVAENRHVPGQLEGAYAGLGYGVDGLLDVSRGRNRFTATLHVLEGLSATIVTPDAVKVADDARAWARYTFQIVPWLSFYASASVELPLFESRTLPAEVQTFIVRHVDRTEELRFGRSLRLTRPLLPLFAREHAGFEARALNFSFATLNVAIALGGEHELASGQLALESDPHTTVVTADEIETYHALGPLMSVSFVGHISTRLAYTAEAEVRFPLAHTATAVASGVSLAGLTELDARHSLRIELVPWLTVDYDLAVGWRPLFRRDVQIENRLMLSARPLAFQ